MILVTGCAGFIGSHLCESLLKDNINVVGIDNFDPYYDQYLKKKNLSILERFHHFKFLQYDITRQNDLASLFARYSFTHIVHLAARPGVSPSLKNPLIYERINTYGTLVILEEIRKHNKKPVFIFGSSSSVYGGVKKVPFFENANLAKQLSSYGMSKIGAETYCRLYHDLYKIPMVILRLFTVYGPRVRPDMAIIKFISALDKGNKITLYNNGEVERDYTYISDVVDGIKLALNKKFIYEIINLGNSQPVKIRQLVKLLEEAIGKKANITNLPLPSTEMPKTWADISKAKDLLSWKPKIKIGEGVCKLVAWYYENK